jgi:hypothetical protein
MLLATVCPCPGLGAIPVTVYEIKSVFPRGLHKPFEKLSALCDGFKGRDKWLYLKRE